MWRTCLLKGLEVPKTRTRSTEVDAYIATQPTEVQRALEQLRNYIWEAAGPEIVEMINYAIPAFALVEGGKRDQQIMIAGNAKSVGFYPHPDVIKAFEKRLAPYEHAKGSVQFLLSEPLPKALVVEMVKHRVKQLKSAT